MASSSVEDVRMSHVGMAVADLDASTRFYTEGLGFEAGHPSSPATRRPPCPRSSRRYA
jgi:catechol-2,3-dioxygenase